MADITEFVLKKYYGFGADPSNKKFLSSYEATYDPSRFNKKSDKTEMTKTETIEEANIQGIRTEVAENDTDNSNQGDSNGKEIFRSSRVILDDDILEDEKSEINEYDELLESSARSQKEILIIKDKKIMSEGNDLSSLKNVKINESEELTRNDYEMMGHFEDIVSENASDVSTISTRKKSKKKSTLINSSNVTSLTAQLPKKLPACNGVFLDLTNLSLMEFPIDMLTNTPNLRMLYLENNSLTKLPEQLFSCLRLLQWLDVRNNELTDLPTSIKYHQCLETILLDGNLFEKLPLELCLLPSLKELQTSRNPLIFPPPDILGLGFAATINFLRIEWNKLHPDEIVESPERDRKPKPSMILCSDPPILRTILKSSRIFGSSSTGHMAEGTRQISIRQKSRNYRPSNRCKNQGTDEELERRLLWIAKVREMLTEQAVALQKIKDRDALNDWRRDRRSYEKSMSRAKCRTEEDIPFGIDLEDIGLLLKNRLKMPLHGSKSKKQGPESPTNINEKMTDLYESLKRLQKARNSDTLSPRREQKLLENEIKKLSSMHDEIQNLQRYNETTTVPFEGSVDLPETRPYKPPPSIIV